SRYFFFFSSRRRHTRFSRDWSSDVCSSDLASFRNGGDDLVFEPFHMVWIHARLQHAGAPDSDQVVALVGMRGRDQRVIDAEFGRQGLADIDDVRIHKSDGVDRDQRYAMIAIVEHHGSGPYLIVDAVGGLVVVESRDPYRVKLSVSIEVVVRLSFVVSGVPVGVVPGVGD